MSLAPATAPSPDNDAFFPFGLNPNTQQYEYRGKKHFLSTRAQELDLFRGDRTGTRSQYIIYWGIHRDTFCRDFENTEDEFNVESYFPCLGIILIKMISPPHEVAHERISSIMTLKLAAMNRMDKNVFETGRSDRTTVQRTKQPDTSYQPKRLPKGRSRQWPTLTIEAGYSESRRKLADDARWWLTASQGDVKAVVTISIGQKQRSITFEKWALVQQQPAVAYRAVLSQEDGRNSIHTTNDNPLIISFQDMFLRPAQGEKEKDIEIEMDDLKEMAESVWEVRDRGDSYRL
ncbi:hypothetical protein BGW36DRAFT_364041 [Talaromyces proteolyticus]|uniref:Uncharacterized protein n=1 Tax=Talaromyces proteolyticus TaxID=1131652 RepID=A0AAD4KFG3_9EURO|nr:uncharacterized protein BGW36DRAFT_364041 [Talaromyces proteolyticus]KAH8690461.1 hypothetical protein BGW36DRAFT_364041 [Talaromyces proteolyticus]